MSRNQEVTAEDIEEMRKLRSEDLSYQEIGERVGWSRQTVHRYTEDVEKKWQDADWLRSEIREKGRTPKEVAEELPISRQTVGRWKSKHDIVHKWQDANWLRSEIREKGKNCKEIAEELPVSPDAVSKWKSKHDIVHKWQDANWLRSEIREKGRTPKEVAEELPISPDAVSKWKNKHDIVHKWRDEKLLRRLYHEEELTLMEIAERWDISDTAVRRNMILNGIERRDPKSGNPGDIIPDTYYGPNWKEIRVEALERDNFTCQKEGCSENGTGLDVHHIIPISEFDDVEDAHYLDNLVTLCHLHHMQVESGDDDQFLSTKEK